MKLYPEIVQPSVKVTWKLHNLWVTIPGNCATSGYSNPEIGMQKAFFHKYLSKNENIFKNILGYRFMKKIRGRKSHGTVPLMDKMNEVRRYTSVHKYAHSV